MKRKNNNITQNRMSERCKKWNYYNEKKIVNDNMDRNVSNL